MKPIPLFVSLPPKMSRSSPAGAEVGPTYARDCVRSWVSAGFDPVTINSVNENPMQLDGVASSIIDRDAAAEYGKSVPYFSDFLAKIAEGDGVIAITNADILFRLDANDLSRIHNLAHDECVVMNRHDIEQPSDESGEIYPYGYDFVACHAEVFRRMKVRRLAIGIPWWDYFLPLWFKFNDLKSVRLDTQVMHLKHEERWDAAHWLSIGSDFETILRDSLHRPTADTHGFSRFLEQTYLHRAREIISPEKHPKNVDIAFFCVAEIEKWRAKTG